MPIRGVARVQTDDKSLSYVQDNLIKAITDLQAAPTIRGQILSSIILTSGDNTVNHLLGRTLVGWHIVRQRASATIYDKQDTNTSTDSTLVLNASAAVTVDILVF